MTAIDGRTKLLKKKDDLIEELKQLEEEEALEKEVALEERDQTSSSPHRPAKKINRE